MKFAFLLMLLVSAANGAGRLEQRIDHALAASPAAARAYWGIRVVNLGSGAVVYQHNAAQYFIPASNTKLFSTALALTRLGPDYRFQTRISTDFEPDSTGRLRGDLRLIGGGDPTLSGRVIPYQKNAAPGEALRAIEELAGQVVARGVRRIDGDILGDDTAYVWDPYPAGWAENDTVWEYGAPVSALTVNDNAFTLTLKPGERAGDPARVLLSPAFEYYAIDNRVRTEEGGPTRIHITRLPGSRQLQISGAIPTGSDGYSELLAIDDPALYAACVLADALQRRGVLILGVPRARHRGAGDAPAVEPAGVELARRTSEPLVELIRVVDKVSQNLHAELMLREVGRVRRTGSLTGGLEELRAFLKEVGVDKNDYQFEDASGLSRLTQVTPVAVTRLLAHMYGTPHRERWMAALPVGGEDGTLGRRFDRKPEARRILAKTGTVSHVSALSGYVESKSSGWLAFSMIVNNYHAPAAEIRRVIDRIALILTE